MIIGIDGNEANVDRRVGISEYAFELLKQFSAFDLDIRFRIYLKSKPLLHMPNETPRWQYEIVQPRRFWTQVGLPFNLYTSKTKPDVFFTPSHYAPRFSPVPIAVSVMDLSYVRFPQLFTKHDLYQLTNWTRYSVKNAKKVFTISNSSKNDIIKHYQVPEEKVIVTYPGIKHKSMGEGRKILGISENYILFVGTLQPRKNITRLIEAFSMMRDKGKGLKVKNLQLVIVGKKGWQFEDILAAPKKFGVEDDVKFLDYVSNEDLPSLYKNAVCYVLPSLYEGFGLPVLEAMQYGCPVITSNVSSLPEAGGDAAVYVDPMNVDDIADKITLVVSDEKLRQELIAKGKKQIQNFSWEKTAKETLDVLEKIGRSR